MLCSKCGKAMEDNSFYCPFCGQKMELSKIRNVQHSPDSSFCSRNQIKLNSWSKNKILSVSCVFLSVVFALFFFIANSSQTAILHDIASSVSLLKKHTNQTKHYKGWQRVFIHDFGELEIPPTLEVQSKDYNEAAIKVMPTLESDGITRIVAQQKGLNDKNPNAFKYFVRVVVKGWKLHEDLNIDDMTEKDLIDFEEITLEGRENLLKDFAGNEYKFLGVQQHAIIKKVNGKPCVNYSFKMQMNKNSPQVHEIWMFTQGNKAIMIQTIIRESEYGKWTSVGDNVNDVVNTLVMY